MGFFISISVVDSIQCMVMLSISHFDFAIQFSLILVCQISNLCLCEHCVFKEGGVWCCGPRDQNSWDWRVFIMWGVVLKVTWVRYGITEGRVRFIRHVCRISLHCLGQPSP